ncbi:hypothetical protein D3C87_1377990 [compost metagenome]
MLFHQRQLDVGSVFRARITARDEIDFGVAAIRLGYLFHIAADLALPLFLGADRKRPPFTRGLWLPYVPAPGDLRADFVGFSINLAITSATRASVWTQIRADFDGGQLACEFLENILVVARRDRVQVVCQHLPCEREFYAASCVRKQVGAPLPHKAGRRTTRAVFG